MRSACRGRGVASGRGRVAVFAALTGSCSVATAPQRPATAAAAARPHWTTLEAARGWPTAAAPFESTSHGVARVLLEVRVTPEHLEAYRGLAAGRLAPPGIQVAAFHRYPDGSAGSIYAMSKSPTGGWSFVVVSANGRVEPDATDSCARCHSDAPSDHLFGVPRARPGSRAGN